MYFKINELRAAKAFDAGDKSGRPIKVIYHSHCDAGAYFSQEDAATFASDNMLMWPCAFIVVSVQDGQIADKKLWVHVPGSNDFRESTLDHPMNDIEELSCDLLIIGGGAAGCIAAVEAREKAPDLDVLMVEKAHIYRSGCLAAGISALNAYLTTGRDGRVVPALHDARHPRHRARRPRAEHGARAERAGAPRGEAGACPSRATRTASRSSAAAPRSRSSASASSRSSARRAEASGARILNRINITGLATHRGRVIGAFGFHVRTGRFYAIRAKATLLCTGGTAGLYRPNNPGMANHRMWYSPFNTGAGLAMGIRSGAEMTSFEFRFIPLRIKDAIAPTGEIAQWLGAKQINALRRGLPRQVLPAPGRLAHDHAGPPVRDPAGEAGGARPLLPRPQQRRPAQARRHHARLPVDGAARGDAAAGRDVLRARRRHDGARGDHGQRAARGGRPRSVRLLDRRRAAHHPARTVGRRRRRGRLAQEVRARRLGRGRAGRSRA